MLTAPGHPHGGSHPNGGLLSLDVARAAIAADDTGKWDTPTLRRALVMKGAKLELHLTPEGRATTGDQGCPVRLTPTRWAFGQFCQRLGMPPAYLALCPEPLVDVQANYWLKSGSILKAGRAVQATEETLATPKPVTHKEAGNLDETWLLRAKHDRLRAVLSARYSPLDNRQLLDALAPLLEAKWRLDWFALGEDGMHLRLIDPSRTREVRPGDPICSGIHVRNGETGQYSISVDTLVWRQVCSNGLIALVAGESLLRRRHVHIEPRRFQAMLEEAIAQALGHGERMAERFRASVKETVPDPESALEHLGERWGLSQSVQDAAKTALARDEASLQHTAYGLVNALTATAQLLADDKRYDLEVLAGRLVEYGVPAFALAPRERKVTGGGESFGQESTVVDYAREKFEAQVMDRVPTTAGGGR